MIAHAVYSDVRVVEVRRSNVGEPDRCYVEVARGNVAVQLSGSLRELQVIAVAITDGLVRIGEARGWEGR